MFVFVVLTEIVDKEKSQELAKILGIQLPDNFATLDFNTVIRKSRAFVNPPAEKNQKSDLAEMPRGTERNRRGRKRLRREKRKELRSDTEKTEHGFGCRRGGARQQKEGEQRKAFVVGKKQGEAERRRADEDACGNAPEPLGEGRGRMFYRACDRQEECRSREEPRGHGIIVRGKYGEREERGEGSPAQDEVSRAVKVAVYELQEERDRDADGEARQHVRGVVHAEVNAGAHDEENEQKRRSPYPYPLCAQRSRAKKTARRLRVPARKGDVVAQIERGEEGSIDCPQARRARNVGARARDRRFQAGVEGERGKGGNGDLFARFFLTQPVNENDERADEQRFPEKGKNAEHNVERGAAQSFKKLEYDGIHGKIIAQF